MPSFLTVILLISSALARMTFAQTPVAAPLAPGFSNYAVTNFYNNPTCSGTPYSYGAYPSDFCDISPSTSIMSSCFNTTHNLFRRWNTNSCNGSPSYTQYYLANTCIPGGSGVYLLYNCSAGVPNQSYYGLYSTDFATINECQAGPSYAQRQNYNDFSCRGTYSYSCNSTGLYMRSCTGDGCTGTCTVNPYSYASNGNGTCLDANGTGWPFAYYVCRPAPPAPVAPPVAPTPPTSGGSNGAPTGSNGAPTATARAPSAAVSMKASAIFVSAVSVLAAVL